VNGSPACSTNVRVIEGRPVLSSPMDGLKKDDQGVLPMSWSMVDVGVLPFDVGLLEWLWRR
jgi:hypothetical protein